MVLKKFEPQLSCILADLFNMCQEESSRLLEGLICGRSHLLVLKNVRDRSSAETTTLSVFIQWLVKSDLLRFADHLEKCQFVSD